MKKSSYLRFNPQTGEVELEGFEAFIKTYFDKLQHTLVPSSGEAKKVPEEAITLPVIKATVKAKSRSATPAPRKLVKVASKKAAARESKDLSLIAKVVGLIQGSGKGMTTAALKDKTGLTKKQIWAITSRAVKLDRIKTTKRGLYLPG